MLMESTPDMNCATERKTEVRFTAKPVWAKRVLNFCSVSDDVGRREGRRRTMIPRLSPQDTIQKQLKKQTKNTCGVRGSPDARSTRMAKMKQVKISKGTSRVMY